MDKQDPTRRQFLKGAAATLLGGSLAGCGSDSEPDAEPTESRTPTDSPTPASTETPTPTPTATPTETPTPTESPTPEKPEPGIAPEIRFEDSEGLTRQLGEEEIKNGDLQQNQKIYTLQMDKEERKQLYREDAINMIGEKKVNKISDLLEEWSKEYNYDIKNYIVAVHNAMKKAGVERSNFGSEEWTRLKMTCTRESLSRARGDDLDISRVGFIPIVDTESTLERETEYLVGGEVIDTGENYHVLKWMDAYDPSSQRRPPGQNGFLDGKEGKIYAATEPDLMADQATGPVDDTLTTSAEDVQGMFRDLIIGFTNWNSIHDFLEFEGRGEVNINGFERAGDETPTPTPTPKPEDQPPLRFAAHLPYMRDAKEARLESDEEKMDYIIDTSDVLTDYILNADHEDTYGILLGGEVDNPYAITVSEEHKELFHKVRDFEADRNRILPEIAEEYRREKTGS